MFGRTRTLAGAALFAFVLVVGGAALPVPYVALGPGPVTDTLGRNGGKPLISMNARPTV